MDNVYELIFACFVTGCLVLGFVMLVDYERQRKFDAKEKRKEIRRTFEFKMEMLRDEWEDEHLGEIRMVVKRNRKKDKDWVA